MSSVADTENRAESLVSPWPTETWYFAGLSRDLKPGKQTRRMVCGEPVLVGRTELGDPFALRDICPHRLVPLSAGRQLETDGEPTVECPYHGWRFGTDGVCRLMPSLVEEDNIDPGRVKVRRYPVREVAGVIFVFVHSDPRDTSEPDAAMPLLADIPGDAKFAVETVLSRDFTSVWAELARGAPAGQQALLIQGDAAGQNVTVICATPEDAGKTRVAELHFWPRSLLKDLGLPLVKSNARKALLARLADHLRPPSP